MTAGAELFARYAFPPNELGYCGPGDTRPDELASHARDFDGAWPYLMAIADALGGLVEIGFAVGDLMGVGGDALEIAGGVFDALP